MRRIAFVDVDGTLTTKESSWELVHRHFDFVDEMEKHSKRFNKGEISYEEWALLDVGLWKGKPVEDLHKALLPPNLIKGAREGIEMIKNAGYDIILLSGGIDILVNAVAREVGADKAYSNTIGHSNGTIDGTINVTVGLKAFVIDQISKKDKVDLKNSIAIGDNFNDIDMFEKIGNSIAFNPKNENVAKAANVAIVSDNFVDVANYVIESIR